jgi:hypothetical protein
VLTETEILNRERQKTTDEEMSVTLSAVSQSPLLNGAGTDITLEEQEQCGNVWLINIIIYLQVKYETCIPEFIVEIYY